MRALIALEEARGSEEVLEVIAPGLRERAAEVHLLTTVDGSRVRGVSFLEPGEAPSARPAWPTTSLSIGHPRRWVVEDLVQALSHVRAQQREALAELAAQHLGGLRCETHVEFSKRPAEAIVGFATGIGADAIVVGTIGRRGLRRLMFGSVSDEVIRRARVPVVVVPRSLRDRVEPAPHRPSLLTTQKLG